MNRDLEQTELDAISRQAAIDIVSNHTFYADYENMDELSLIDGLKALSSVSTEKTGRWIPYCYQNCECSICGYIISESDSEEFNFCPNCGAKIGVE